MAKTIDMIGKTFGKQTVIERAEDEVLSNGHKAVRYRCRCECGNTTVVRGTALRALLARHQVPRFTVPMQAIRLACPAHKSAGAGAHTTVGRGLAPAAGRRAKYHLLSS